MLLSKQGGSGDVFFEPESQFPRIEFGIESVYLDQHISNFKFELGGQSMMYRHGPTRVMQFTWPWKGESSKVRLVFTPPQSGHSITKNYAGSWGGYSECWMRQQGTEAKPVKIIS